MNKRHALSSFIVILLIAGIAGGTIWLNRTATTTNQANQTATETSSEQSNQSSPVTATETDSTTDSNTDSSSDSDVQAETSDGKYQDGTYQATGRYVSPGGVESIAVSLTLDDDLVTQASVDSQAENQSSKQYQQYFISGYKKYVIGKNIDDIKLTRVSGSSLTSMGFNQALATIKTQAQS